MDKNLIARLTIHKSDSLSESMRKQLIDWIRAQADELEKHWDSFSAHYTMRFLKNER